MENKNDGASCTAEDIARSLFLAIHKPVDTIMDKLREQSTIESNDMPRIEGELMFYSWFCLDYWLWDTGSQAVRNAFSATITEYANNELMSEGEQYSLIYTSNRRNKQYVKIVNNSNNKNVFHHLSIILGDLCGLGTPSCSAIQFGILVTMAAPNLFTDAQQYVYVAMKNMSYDEW